MSIKPFFSIILSINNGENFIEDCFNKIFDQTFTDYELIVIDDASTDNTLNKIYTWVPKFRNLTVLRNGINRGLTYSLNKGIGIAKGQYIARIDVDDLWHPEKLMKQYDFLKNHHNVGVLGTNGHAIDKIGNYVRKTILPEDDIGIKKRIFKRNPFIHSAIVIKRALLNMHGGYNNRFKYTQDYELWLRLYDKTVFHNLQEPLVFKRILDDNISATKWKYQLQTTIHIRFNFYRSRKVPFYYYFLLLPDVAKSCLPTKSKIWKRRIVKALKRMTSFFSFRGAEVSRNGKK